MRKDLIGVVLYLYFKIFKRNIKMDFPCKVSPYFALKLMKKNINVSLASAFIGRDVAISDGCCFYENPILFGNVTIGRYTSINGPGTRIFAKKNRIIIGSFCSIASNVIIQEYNHSINRVTSYPIFSHIFNENVEEIASKGNVVIEDDVWIGSNTVILSGVRIGRGTVIGAGCVVSKDIPAYSIVVGNPAKVIKKRFSEDKISELEDSKWWEWDIQMILNNREFFISEIVE